MPAEPDAGQVERLRSGEPAAIRGWLASQEPRLYRLAYRLLGERMGAQDCVQDAFTRALGAIERFRGDADINTWLYRILIRVTLDERRRVRRRERFYAPLDENILPRVMPEHRDPYLSARIHAAVDGLPIGLRLPLILFDMEDRSHADIGRIMNISPGASRVRVTRARAHLRVALADLATE